MVSYSPGSTGAADVQSCKRGGDARCMLDNFPAKDLRAEILLKPIFPAAQIS